MILYFFQNIMCRNKTNIIYYFLLCCFLIIYFRMKFILVLTFLISTLTSFSQINLIKKVSEKAESLINKDVKLTESEIVEGLTEVLKQRVFIFCKCIFR